jgi:hypothetical protein
LKGYGKYLVPSGEEAVKYVQENSVDLMVLDKIMDPGIYGSTLRTLEGIT